MPIDLREDKTLASRPRLKATCIKLNDLAQELGPEAKLPTIAELKTSLGVSVYTLNDAVRELERRQVLRSVNGVGIYVTPRKRTWTGNIGIAGSSAFRRPQLDYHHLVLRGIEQQAEQHGQHLLFLGTEATWDARCCEKVDGLLAIGADKAHEFLRLVPADVPVVTVFTTAPHATSVVVDDYQGGKLAVEYLCSLQHQRIACLMEERPTLSRLRFNGYKDALAAAGIELKPEWTRLTPTVDVTQDERAYLNWGRSQMEQWLQQGWSEANCTAIFVQNETAAIGVMQVLQEAGLEVPGDVSVIGFDGTPLCDYVAPRLCAVEIPLAEIGAKAMELLNQRLENQNEPPQTVVMPLRIRAGNSVAPPCHNN